MGCDPISCLFAKTVRQSFGQSFDGRLGDIVSRVARGLSDALLRSCVDDKSGASPRSHPLREYAASMYYSVEVHGEKSVPDGRVTNHITAAPNSSVVYCDSDVTELAFHPLNSSFKLSSVGHVSLNCEHAVPLLRYAGRDFTLVVRGDCRVGRALVHHDLDLVTMIGSVSRRKQKIQPLPSAASTIAAALL